MSTAKPMANDRREGAYRAQTRRKSLTPKQRRRRDQKAAQAALHAVMERQP